MCTCYTLRALETEIYHVLLFIQYAANEILITIKTIAYRICNETFNMLYNNGKITAIV